MLLLNTLLAQADNVFGPRVSAPPGVTNFNEQTGGVSNGIGIIIFISNLIKISSVIAGIWVMLNIILAGYDYITGGEKGASAARDRITMSIIGLVIIVCAYTIAGLIGLLIFGDAGYIINPQICGPEGCP